VLRSLRTAEQAMQREQVRVESLANNLANANTNGFKQILTSVEQAGAAGADPLAPAAGPDPRPNLTARPRAGGPELWPRQPTLRMLQATDPRPGVMHSTGRATDVAVLGEGYFVVETSAGEMYTRDGSFRVDAEGRLVTATGDAVLGTGGPLRVEEGPISIAEDGSVSVDGVAKGRLRLVRFPDATRLEHRGGSLLTAPPDMAAEDLPKDETRLAQGQLESSNVNPVETLIDMIAAQRAFEIASSVVRANDELLQKSVNQLPRSR
jgi:flagellar basal-body rod protein FlgG